MKILKEDSKLRYKNMSYRKRMWIDDLFHRNGSDWGDTLIAWMINFLILLFITFLIFAFMVVYSEVTKPEAVKEAEDRRWDAKVCSGEEYAEVERDWFLKNCDARIEAK